MVHHFWAGLHCVSIFIKELSTYQYIYEIFCRHCMAFQFHPSRLCPSSSRPLIRWMSVWRCVDSSSPTPTVWPAPPPPPAVPWSGGPSKLGGDLLWPRHFPSTRWKCFRYWSYMMICLSVECREFYLILCAVYLDVYGCIENNPGYKLCSPPIRFRYPYVFASPHI